MRIGGRSLVQMAIDVAFESAVCDVVVVTSDDPVLLRQAERRGAIAIRRPRRLAGPSSVVVDAVRHVLAKVELVLQQEVDAIVLLQPTTPLRNARDVRAAVSLNARPTRPNVVTVVPVKQAGWLCRLGPDLRIVPLARSTLAARRQEVAMAYSPNGAVYVLTRRRLNQPWYRNAVGYVMPVERSIDVDNIHDLRLARMVHDGARARRR